MHSNRRTPSRRAFAGALLASAIAHGLFALWALPRLGTRVVLPELRQPMTVVVVPREVFAKPAPNRVPPSKPAPNRVPPSKPAPNQVAVRNLIGGRFPSEGPTPLGTPSQAVESGGGDGIVGALTERRERGTREALSPDGERLVTWRGATGTPGGPRSPTDSIDGRPRLGTGEPGDPRIPGSGNVDIVAVVERDAVVAQAQERARQGQVHPFLGAVKERVETCWLPVIADADSVTRYIAVEDGVCAKGYHLRRNVGRVYAVYDPNGARLAIELDTGPDGSAAVLLRNLKERVQRAFDEAGMRDVPPELLDEKGLLRVAWNVFIDDYRGCDLQGQGANAHKPGGDEIIGIVELDGMY